MKATSDPATFSYAELLYLPNIQKLAEAVEQYSRCLQLLEIFAFGNLQDYRSE